MRRFAPWVGFVLLAVPTLGSAQMFREVPGVQEFTGEMIVRPLQAQAQIRRGTPVHVILARSQEARRLVASTALEHVSETDEYIVRVPNGQDENSLARRLMATGLYEYVEPNWRLFPTATPNDPLYNQQWHHPRIQAPNAWDLFRGDLGVIVAICDTGVRLTHEDFQGRLVSGFNSASDLAQSSGGAVTDVNGHGTHCAGIAGAIGGNGRGVAGANWNARIMPIRVTNSSGGSASLTDLTQGARWAADNGARVVSTSYSGVSSASVQTTGNYIKTQRNGIYLWAAGNDNRERTVDHVDVTIVGASDQNDGKANFSAFGVAIDVFAPGVSILSTYNQSDTQYVFLSGTSMACPLAAGVASVIMNANPTLTGAQVETILYRTSSDLTAAPGGVGNDNYWGWGRVDLNAALRDVYTNFAFNTTEFRLVTGSLVGGSLPELVSSDASRLTVQIPGFSLSNRIQTQTEFTTRSTVLGSRPIRFRYNAWANSPGLTTFVEAFNWSQNRYDTIVSFPTAQATDERTILIGNTPTYLESGTGRIRVRTRHQVTGFTTQARPRIGIDRAVFFTQP